MSKLLMIVHLITIEREKKMVKGKRRNAKIGEKCTTSAYISINICPVSPQINAYAFVYERLVKWRILFMCWHSSGTQKEQACHELLLLLLSLSFGGSYRFCIESSNIKFRMVFFPPKMVDCRCK